MAGTPARLTYLDGVRGLTSLFIVCSHVYWEICPNGDSTVFPPAVAATLHPFAFSSKVGIFFVVSGYCMALPLARHRTTALRGGTADFLKRRARRILPPYYGALALALLLIAVAPPLHRLSPGARWSDTALPAFTGDAILSHLLLLHDLRPEWLLRIDPPMWSLAIEWQLYFVFALLLVPLWRRIGLVTCVAIGTALGYLPHLLLAPDRNFDWATPWYLCLYCLGMAAAGCYHRPDSAYRMGKVGALAFGAAVIGLIAAGPDWCGAHHLIADPIVGAFAACFLAFATASIQLDRPTGPVRLLRSRFPVAIGQFSYSLYLVHFPLLSLTHLLLAAHFPALHIHYTRAILLLYLTGVPLSLAAAYLFYLAFERPFLAAKRVPGAESAPAGFSAMAAATRDAALPAE